MVDPIRTLVAPCAMAVSKSLDMPMDNSRFKPKLWFMVSASDFSATKSGLLSNPDEDAEPMVIKPCSLMC